MALESKPAGNINDVRGADISGRKRGSSSPLLTGCQPGIAGADPLLQGSVRYPAGPGATTAYQCQRNSSITQPRSTRHGSGSVGAQLISIQLALWRQPRMPGLQLFLQF
jgi:hypothetical protein